MKDADSVFTSQSDIYQTLCKFFSPKTFTNHHEPRSAQVTKWVEVTVLELYHKFQQEEKDNHRKPDEEENCPICMCELYEGLEKMTEQQRIEMDQQQIDRKVPIDVVCMSKCTDHCFHKQCLEQQMGKSECIRCAVCSQIYGVLTGQMPTGSMKWRLQKSDNGYNCQGFEGIDIWEISYSFPNGKRNGVNYHGTGRVAYLPNNQEGREVLALLVKAFERRLTFTVGTSVTTGATNTVVWAGIHHKTALYGGTSCFGYPDPTYFNRVKLELADRGVVLESQEEINRVTHRMYGSIHVI